MLQWWEEASGGENHAAETGSGKRVGRRIFGHRGREGAESARCARWASAVMRARQLVTQGNEGTGVGRRPSSGRNKTSRTELVPTHAGPEAAAERQEMGAVETGGEPGQGRTKPVRERTAEA